MSRVPNRDCTSPSGSSSAGLFADTLGMQHAAQTILAQLGGIQFLVMTGSRDIVSGQGFLQVRLGSGAKGAMTHLRVSLASDDTYTVQVSRLRGSSFKIATIMDGVYAENLRGTVERLTGFYCTF